MDSIYFHREKPVIPQFDHDVFVNQAGFTPDGPKRAIIRIPCEQFYLRNEYNIDVYTGNAAHFGVDECSGDDVYIADFSDFHSEGEYVLITDGGARSIRFMISRDVYRPVFDALVKAFYYQRCGCELKKEHAGVFTHPSCHTETAKEWGGGDKEYDVTGGWHDAGDYGRYVTAGASAAAHLLYAYKLFPSAFGRQKLNIPECGALPDILAEVRYELEWLMKMQREDGAVWHKVTTARHAPFIMPQDDKEQLYLFSPSSMATADLAAVCALASEMYREYDGDFADSLYNTSIKSYKWLEDNPGFLGFDNPEGCNTGTYGERTDVDNRFWAAAQLYALTGEDKYFKRIDSAMLGFSMSDLGFASVGGFGSLALWLCDRPIPDRMRDRIKRDFNSKAEELKGLCASCGYGCAMGSWHYIWGSTMNLLKHAMIFIIADRINGNDKYHRFAAAQLDYLLGTNATGYSFITGCGEFACKSPHLRTAYADGIEECIPGFVSGGPNASPADEDARVLIPPGTPPMKCFVDDVGCYSLNEVAIYWNSPAVFLTAYMIDHTEHKKG